MTMLDIQPPEARPRQEDARVDPRALATGVWHHIRKDGSTLDVEVATDRMTIDGKDARLVIIQDVTKRAATERELSEIQAGVARINQLVQSLARFTKKRPPERREIDLTACIAEAVHLFEAATHGKVDIAKDLWTTPVLADEGQVQQIVLNLPQNGADAMGGSGRLHVRVHESLAGPEFTIRDEGMGISEELKHRIFEPLFTTKSEGMGL